MYNSGSYKDLIQIDFQEVREFIVSSKDELSFFNCNVKNLVSLKDYLIELKQKKSEYDKMIKEPLSSIQEKNPWCIDVQPAIRSPFIMSAIAKNYPSIYISHENNIFLGSGIQVSYNPFIRYLDHKRWNKRREIVKNSKEELLEIKKIIESFDFNSENKGLITASQHFLVVPYNFGKVIIQKRRKNDLYGHETILNEDGKFSYELNKIFENDNKENKNHANSFAKKLYLTKK